MYNTIYIYCCEVDISILKAPPPYCYFLIIMYIISQYRFIDQGVISVLRHTKSNKYIVFVKNTRDVFRETMMLQWTRTNEMIIKRVWGGH